MDTNTILTSFRDAMERARAAGAVNESEEEQTAIQEALAHAESLDAAMLDGAAIPADWISGRVTLNTAQIRCGTGFMRDAQWLEL